MSKLERITVTMPEEMVARLRAAVESGEYATTSEVVREALRDWGDMQERRDIALQTLKDQLDHARRGPFVDGPSYMEGLRNRMATKVAGNE